MFEKSADLASARARIVEILDALAEFDGAAEGRALDVDARTQWEALEAEFEFREGEVRAYERTENLRASRDKYKTVQVKAKVDGPTEIDARTASRETVRDSARSLLDSRESASHLNAEQREHVERLITSRNRNVNGDQVARMLVATENPAYRSAFQQYAATGREHYDANELRAVREVAEIRAMSLTAGNGGYSVPTLVDPTIILTDQGNSNDILSLARVETITTDKWIGLSSAGASWGFHAEAAEVTDNSPTVAQPSVTARRADGFIPFSIEIEMDWPSFAAEMSLMLREGYRELLVEKLTTGTNGSNEPDGLITSLDATTTPANLVLATAATLTAGDLYDLWDALPQKYRGNATFLSSTDVQNSVRQLGTANGPNFTVDITSEGVPRFFGKAYPLNDYMADMPSATGNQPLLAVGDFKGYLVAQRAGMSVEFVPHLFHTNANRPSGQRGFFAWARVGGGLINPKAFRLLVNKPS